MTCDRVAAWEVTISRGPAGPFHELLPPSDTGPQIWVHRIPAPALVLGSAQPSEVLHQERLAADGVEVCRRRSGGGLVYLDPDLDCWIDVIVPRSSRLWHHDVGTAFHWLGRHWAAVLRDRLRHRAPAGEPAPEPEIHLTGSRTTAGDLWCFADVGHGEVSIEGWKVVGLSQRRTANWLRLQSLVLARWPGAELGRYVDIDRLRARRPERYPDPSLLDPALVRAGFPPGIEAPDPESLAERFVAALPPP